MHMQMTRVAGFRSRFIWQQLLVLRSLHTLWRASRVAEESYSFRFAISRKMTGWRCPGFNSLRYLGGLRVSAVSFGNSIHRGAAEYAEVAQRIIQTRTTDWVD